MRASCRHPLKQPSFFLAHRHPPASPSHAKLKVKCTMRKTINLCGQIFLSIQWVSQSRMMTSRELITLESFSWTPCGRPKKIWILLFSVRPVRPVSTCKAGPTTARLSSKTTPSLTQVRGPPRTLCEVLQRSFSLLNRRTCFWEPHHLRKIKLQPPWNSVRSQFTQNSLINFNLLPHGCSQLYWMQLLILPAKFIMCLHLKKVLPSNLNRPIRKWPCEIRQSQTSPLGWVILRPSHLPHRQTIIHSTCTLRGRLERTRHRQLTTPVPRCSFSRFSSYNRCKTEGSWASPTNNSRNVWTV